MENKITVLLVGSHERLRRVLEAALAGVDAEQYDLSCQPLPPLSGKRILFAVSVSENGMEETLCRLLLQLRSGKNAMQGACAAMLVDGAGELDTKQLARMLMLAANGAGCWWMGKPLLEATGSLANLKIRAKRLGLDCMAAYYALAAELVHRLQNFSPNPLPAPKLLMLHASNQATSNTLALGRAVCDRLSGVAVREISLRNGTLHDCKGCSYKICAHFAEQGSCFYGGAMVDNVYPAIVESDALLLLCPNYNDAAGANIMAMVNRLTSLTVNDLLSGKRLFTIVVSGYSGSDLVAEQVLGALCLNKSFTLPPHCCMLETANDPGTAMHLPGMEQRLARFAQVIREGLGQ